MSRSVILRLAAIAAVTLAIAAPVVAYGRTSGGPKQDPALTALASFGSSFSFQGRLTDGGAPASGAYDFTFYLYDALAGGSQVGPAQVKDDVAVSGGLFTVSLDFGNVFHGAPYWLEIQVRPGSSVGSYTILSPREALSAVPNASYAAQAGTADAIQGYAVSSAVPANGNVLTFNGTSWVPQAPSGGGGGSLTLPYTASVSSATPAFKITNTGTASDAFALNGESSSTASGGAALVGRLTSTSPGSFSAGVKGINEGTGGAGVGVIGTHAGNGWGVFGASQTGHGLVGLSGGSGSGVNGASTSGAGGSFSSNSGPSIDLSGPIKVSGSRPSAFVHTVTASNQACTGNYCSVIDNVLTNGDPDAIVIVTQLWAGTYNDHAVGVYYNGSKWAIFNEDHSSAMPVGAKFNVLVIKTP